MVVFGIILLIQVIGMLIHRTGTFLHIMSTTSINCCSAGNGDDLLNTKEDYVKLAREMGRLEITETEAPPEPRAPSPSAPDQTPVEADRPEDASGRQNRQKRHQKRHRNKLVNNIIIRSRAPSRSVPTVREAFDYRVEKLRRMTETDINNPERVRDVILLFMLYQFFA